MLIEISINYGETDYFMCKLQGSAYTYTEKLVDEYFQIFSTNRRNSRLKVFSQSKSLKIICEELKFVVKLQDDSLQV